MDESDNKIPPEDIERARELRVKSVDCIAKAERVLRRKSMGEMARQIEQSRQMELAYNYLAQAAILEQDNGLLKHASENASRWAQHCRGATTKRRNDEVPRLMAALADRKKFARALLAIEEAD